ncbi:MFS general substrate transporter [Saccharata proteae CBS 121410]|uniref:MFS general substrate transporter n=1 Tax=Saccharata proteae CBS 121410 TaxID=1314787 RepID=A0A9P4HZ41_9PEZI|nr:MFS general substrate transporter [Saccharata proteae CBS 121410]
MPSDLRPGHPQPLDHDHDLNRRTVRKLDTVLLPFLALLFLFNSLDRSNIGNAETAHFTDDAGLSSDDLNTAVALFFAFFVALQPVGAALGRHYGMARWVPACMATWGVCTALHVWVHAPWQLYTLRIVIGILEAGFYPVTVSYLSLFYTRFEFARRLGLFYGQYAVAGALGGFLSYAVFSAFPVDGGRHAEDGRWMSWQILFLLEGGSTVLIALTGFFWLPHNAQTAWFLTPEERDWAEERIRLDREDGSPAQCTKPSSEDRENDDIENQAEDRGLLSRSISHHRDRSPSSLTTSDRGLTPHDVLSALFSWKIHALLFCNILSAIPTTAFSIFLPLVLAPLSSNNPALTNLLTAPPYILGALTLYIFTAWSDRLQQRILPILVGLGVVLTGFAGLIAFPNSWIAAKYMALCVLLSGTFIASPLTVAWLTNNIPSPGRRAMALGINGWGNVAGVIAALLWKPDKPNGGYATAFVWTAVLVALAFAGFAAFRVGLMVENEKRKEAIRVWDESEVEAERRWGRGPVVRGRRGVGPSGGFLDCMRGMRGMGNVGAVLQAWVDGPREGDERITFVYGL